MVSQRATSCFLHLDSLFRQPNFLSSSYVQKIVTNKEKSAFGGMSELKWLELQFWIAVHHIKGNQEKMRATLEANIDKYAGFRK